MPAPGRYAVYVLANGRRSVFYTGVTNDVGRRLAEHRAAGPDTFCGRYGVRHLVYVEPHADIRAAIMREKQLKRWRRAWKLALVRSQNPTLRDLLPET